MNKQWRLVILSIAFAASYSVYAIDIAHTEAKPTGQDNTTKDANTLSTSDLARAHLWDLSETEWQRYQKLMQGVRGTISPPAISPIEVLGIHARNEGERQRYAEAWARAMHEDVGRILAFQRAYDAATKRLYPNVSLIDTSRLPEKTETKNTFQSMDRLLFFTRPKCPTCDLLLNKLMQRIDEVSGMDIYLTDTAPGDDIAVRDWATTHKIDPDRVRSRQITLNHDAGALDKLTQGQGEVPTVLRRRGENVSRLPVSDL